MVYKNKQLLFDPDALLAAITPKTKAVVIANPNNPTGNFMESKDFERIAQTGVPLVIDEAYVEFAGLERSQVSLTRKYENVIITRTLSKAYGLAGLRFGYILAAKSVIDQIAATLIPWNMGTIPMWAGLAALEDTEALQARVKHNNSELMFLEESLSEIRGLVVFHSYGNYILLDGGPTGKKGKDFVTFAEHKGLILRSEPAMYESDGWWRLTIGSKEENRKLIEVAREFYGK
jgi:histidinol-phosphate aminotransferase